MIFIEAAHFDLSLCYRRFDQPNACELIKLVKCLSVLQNDVWQTFCNKVMQKPHSYVALDFFYPQKLVLQVLLLPKPCNCDLLL